MRTRKPPIRPLSTGFPDGTLADKIVGSLAGGAVGDALGYEVEFDSWPSIVRRFGIDGIRAPVANSGRFDVSDDTQMTLFTAEGLLRAAGSSDAPDVDTAIAEIRRAYLDWYATQRVSARGYKPAGELYNVRELRERRAPGNTCLTALESGGNGTIDEPANDSKGCGGVMRVAPLGFVTAWTPAQAFDAGARASAITHGHSSGYLAGGAMAAIIRMAVDGANLEDAGVRAAEMVKQYRGGGETADAIQAALALASSGKRRCAETVAELGEGWVAEEAIAIGLYAAIVSGSFSEAIAIGANHSGDSDSTASIAAQLYGAFKGRADLSDEWVRGLDVLEPMTVLLRKFAAKFAVESRAKRRVKPTQGPRRAKSRRTSHR